MKFSFLRHILIPLSLVFNILFIALFVLSSAEKPSALTYYAIDGQSFAGALLVNATPGVGIVFNPVELTLHRGDRASVQFPFRMGNAQSNIAINALYDRSIIDVQHTGFGIIITALAAGECILQTISDDGIRDVVFVTVE